MNKIILIGFMGSGKSTVGKRLAKQMCWEFVDTDEAIEREEERSITEIFACKGEPYFRKLEVSCLERILNQEKNLIVSVGGGLPITKENQERLQLETSVIYLKSSVETIYDRVKHNEDRPLLQGDNPMGKIETLLGAREQFYEQAANYIVETDGKTVEEISLEIRGLVEL